VADVEQVTCGSEFYVCLCGLEPGHPPPHRCGRRDVTREDSVCTGSWLDDGTIVSYPNPQLDDVAAGDLLLASMPLQVKRGGIRFQHG
jgi:hypothetical protein